MNIIGIGVSDRSSPKCLSSLKCLPDSDLSNHSLNSNTLKFACSTLEYNLALIDQC